jgi:hypothetical protein
MRLSYLAFPPTPGYIVAPMANKTAIPSEIQASLKRLEDPYAKLSLFDEEDAVTAPAPTMQQRRAYFRNLENPHAYSDIFGEGNHRQLELDMRSDRPTVRRPSSTGLSKGGFRTGCRRIFRQYVPPEEGALLRPQYREFISRNENRTAEQRSRILVELAKYDLSTTGNFQPHFNREQELLTIGKLREIEQKALEDGSSA